MSQLIVGLGFCRQVGKDTLARLLGELDRRFVPYSFAHALKNDLAPFILRHFDGALNREVHTETHAYRGHRGWRACSISVLDLEFWMEAVTMQPVYLSHTTFRYIS